MSSTNLAASLQHRLSTETRCEIHFDRPGRLLYSTDASLYQVEPVGVAVPKSQEDLRAAVQIASELGASVVPRGAATSLSGQTIGNALILDVSKYLNRIGVVDRDQGLVSVEPGVVLDQLNAHLKPLGLMFGPDVSTSDRATLGGMIGNNSAGARSLRYGKTVDHVVSLDVLLDDGTPAKFNPLDEQALERVCSGGDRLGKLHSEVKTVADEHAKAIRARFPRILRRVSGYNLDEFVPGLPVRPVGWPVEPWRFNLSRLVVGSEGTLAVVSKALVKVVSAPKRQGLAVLSFSSMAAALDSVATILESEPVSIELLDKLILDLAAANPDYARHLTFCPGRPAAVLSVQFYAESDAELVSKTTRLSDRFDGKPGVIAAQTALSGPASADFWKVRKGGLALLMGMVGDAKPAAFVEDVAVATERLPEFHKRFEELLSRHGANAACYGHADVGCLHIRPILNLKTVAGVESLRSIASEVSDLVLEFGGAMSGEHGDGMARSVWNKKLFGAEVYSAFERVKRAFDPTHRLNPGKVVGGPDPGESLRISPTYHAHEPAPTLFDFSKQGGFAGAIELCSGVGVCRKTASGTMCPSYMITRDEEHTTRGRANALRLLISGQIEPDGFEGEEIDRVLDLCLECKACKTECPSNVDMAKLKSEYLYQKSRSNGFPLGSLALAHIYLLNRIGSWTPGLANWTLANPVFKWFFEKFLRISRERSLPRFASESFRSWFNSREASGHSGSAGEVVLLDDCFTNFNDPEVAKSAVRVLEAGGYRVKLAGLRCCGRPAISKGLLPLARELAQENVKALIQYAKSGLKIVGCEPSCLLALADEYRDFRLGPDALAVAEASILVDAFVADAAFGPHLKFRPKEGKVLLHGHCQQKALLGTRATIAALRRVPSMNLVELDSGCCGMAGSFGYEKGHYELSVALARRVLLPAIEAEPAATLAAPGFSCRSQVHGLAGIQALHPIQILAEQLEDPRQPEPT